MRKITNIEQVSFGKTPSEGPDGLEVETDDGTFFVVCETRLLDVDVWTIFFASKHPAPYDSGGQVGEDWDSDAEALRALIHRDGE